MTLETIVIVLIDKKQVYRYTDKSDASVALGVSVRTIQRWLKLGWHEATTKRVGGVIVCSSLEDVKSSRGCPKGENRFIKQ
jgi:predicted site-specific integrase-resolvase